MASAWRAWRQWLKHHFGPFTCAGCGNRRFMAYLHIAADAVPPPRSGREERYCERCWPKKMDEVYEENYRKYKEGHNG